MHKVLSGITNFTPLFTCATLARLTTLALLPSLWFQIVQAHPQCGVWLWHRQFTCDVRASTGTAHNQAHTTSQEESSSRPSLHGTIPHFHHSWVHPRTRWQSSAPPSNRALLLALSAQNLAPYCPQHIMVPPLLHTLSVLVLFLLICFSALFLVFSFLCPYDLCMFYLNLLMLPLLPPPLKVDGGCFHLFVCL